MSKLIPEDDVEKEGNLACKFLNSGYMLFIVATSVEYI
jgi:hypothetical protein